MKRYRAYRIDDVWHAGTSSQNDEFKCADRRLAEKTVSQLNNVEEIVSEYFKDVAEAFIMNDHVIKLQSKILRKVLRDKML